jgi:hypothetical protein
VTGCLAWDSICGLFPAAAAAAAAAATVVMLLHSACMHANLVLCCGVCLWLLTVGCHILSTLAHPLSDWAPLLKEGFALAVLAL